MSTPLAYTIQYRYRSRYRQAKWDPVIHSRVYTESNSKTQRTTKCRETERCVSKPYGHFTKLLQYTRHVP